MSFSVFVYFQVQVFLAKRSIILKIKTTMTRKSTKTLEKVAIQSTVLKSTT